MGGFGVVLLGVWVVGWLIALLNDLLLFIRQLHILILSRQIRFLNFLLYRQIRVLASFISVQMFLICMFPQLIATQILKKPLILILAHINMNIIIIMPCPIHINKTEMSSYGNTSVIPQISECSIEDYLVSMG